MTRITSSRPPNAPIGIPPPMLLARQKRSGCTPKYSNAPPQASTTPVFTSSKTSTTPCSVASSRTRSRYPGFGGTTPMLNCTGSTMIAAISSRLASRMSARMSGSLNGAITVSAIRERGMPADAGTVVGCSIGPMCSRGGWMLTRTSSWWPW